MNINEQLLEAAFGPESHGATPEERAASSSRMFVRSLQQLAEDSAQARGRRLTAKEALATYRWATLAQVAADGAALIGGGSRAAARSLELRMRDLGISAREIANISGLPSALVVEALTGDPTVSVRYYEQVAEVLGLDERLLGVREVPTGNDALTVRLRTIGDDQARMTHTVVAAISEAAWVAGTQTRLEGLLDVRPRHDQFQPSSQYGGPNYPAYLHGYFLADEARRLLSLDDQPITSLRELCEDQLGIPLIQTNLGSRIAGVTVEVDGGRAIVLNTNNNDSVLVRRATIAHELGHLLYDPTQQLNSLRVDEYDDLERRPDRVSDPVEQRANAFSVQLLAPQSAILAAFDAAGGAAGQGLAEVVVKFGISPTAARYQVWNGLDRKIPLEQLLVSSRSLGSRLQEWEAREEYTIGYHPLGRLRASRRGRFCAVVVRAAEERVISWDSAALYLGVDASEAQAAATDIRDLFPSVFTSR